MYRGKGKNKRMYRIAIEDSKEMSEVTWKERKRQKMCLWNLYKQYGMMLQKD